MGFETVLGAVGIGLSIAGTAKSVAAAKGAANAQGQAIAAQQKAESARQQQMTLDANNKRRQVIRQAIQARAIAQANATAQGADNSTGLQGGYGQISGREGTSIVGIGQGEELGNTIFSANKEAGSAYARVAQYQAQGSFGAGLSSLGGSILTNIRPITNIFNTLAPRSTNSNGPGGSAGSYRNYYG